MLTLNFHYLNKILHMPYWINKVWVISDTHFNHQFMIDKWIRPNNYAERIINNWKMRVSESDIIIHLWDVIFNEPSQLSEILGKLPWHKILVKGNHDHKKDKRYLDHWFNEVHEEYILTLPNRKRVLCTHKPTTTTLDYNVCWHLHNYKEDLYRHNEAKYLWLKSRVYSCELEEYRPIPIDTIVSDMHQSHIFIKENWNLNMKLWIAKDSFGVKMKTLWKKIYDIGQIKIF